MPAGAEPVAAPLLAGARIDRLGELLEQRAVPFRGLGLEALDGLLSAVVLAPEPIDASEWQPLAWGGRVPRWNDADEAADVQALLAEHQALAARRVRHGDDPLPAHLAPLLWMPDDPDGQADDALDIGRDWATGFFLGVGLREAAWEAWLDSAGWMEEVFMLLDRLASGETLPDAVDGVGTPLGYRERLDIIAALPGMLADLHHHRIEALTPRQPRRRVAAVGRNAACPCGSGRKSKRCCGA